MVTFIALLRGINVGGKNVLPMKALRSTLESMGSWLYAESACAYGGKAAACDRGKSFLRS